MAIVYPKEQRENAARQGMDLFCCGVREAKGRGLMEFVGPLDWRMGAALFAFANKVHCGATPAEAFAAVTWPNGPAATEAPR